MRFCNPLLQMMAALSLPMLATARPITGEEPTAADLPYMNDHELEAIAGKDQLEQLESDERKIEAGILPELRTPTEGSTMQVMAANILYFRRRKRALEQMKPPEEIKAPPALPVPQFQRYSFLSKSVHVETQAEKLTRIKTKRNQQMKAGRQRRAAKRR